MLLPQFVMLTLLDLPLQLTISLQKEDNDPEKNQFDEHFYAGG
jgi:DNA gyrase subunit B